ncbi:MAG: hypothetical protein QOD32_1738, partial [Pyrinomonadaceae bacterium]|nr:hypothetical protein [Pyrinomonadaceae bacterium]
MAKTDAGSGRLATASELAAFNKMRGLDLPETIDLNRTPPEIMSAHPLIGKSATAKIMRLRKQGAIGTPADLYHAGVIDAERLSLLEQVSFGRVAVRPMITE